ncbi:hypothetical protein BPTFM16_01834 [Altererythrobacter insulae]|nr:hypothetical protein BPTFM16_01834 [Altererythrobacter insulae]
MFQTAAILDGGVDLRIAQKPPSELSFHKTATLSMYSHNAGRRPKHRSGAEVVRQAMLLSPKRAKRVEQRQERAKSVCLAAQQLGASLSYCSPALHRCAALAQQISTSNTNGPGDWSLAPRAPYHRRGTFLFNLKWSKHYKKAVRLCDRNDGFLPILRREKA